MTEPGVDVTGVPILGPDDELLDDPVEEAVLDLIFGQQRVEEAYAYREAEHLRDRLGRWRDMPDPPDVFGTVESATAFLRQKWPDKQFNLVGSDMSVTGPALAQFVRLADTFPFAVRGDRFAGIVMSSPDDPDDFSRKLSANAHAGVRRDDNMLLLNPASWGDPPEFLAALETAELAEWHPPMAATPTAMITHEFGHFLDRALTRPTVKPDYGAKEVAWKVPYSSGWDGYGLVGKTWEYWKKEADVLPVSGYAQRASKDAFGGVDNSERVAEAFSSIFHTPPELQDEYVQRLAALLHDIADESKWVPATNDRAIGWEGRPLSEEEKQAWDEEMRDWKARRMGSMWTLRNDKSDRYNEIYGDEYQQAVSDLYDRRRALTAELREREKVKKAAAHEREMAERKVRREDALADWLKLKNALVEQGLEGDELRARLEEDGFQVAWTSNYFDPGRGADHIKKLAKAALEKARAAGVKV